MKNSVVHVRVNEELKNNVKDILKDLGLSMAYAINMYLKQIELKRGIPFDVVLEVTLKLTMLTIFLIFIKCYLTMYTNGLENQGQ